MNIIKRANILLDAKRDFGEVDPKELMDFLKKQGNKPDKEITKLLMKKFDLDSTDAGRALELIRDEELLELTNEKEIAQKIAKQIHSRNLKGKQIRTLVDSFARESGVDYVKLYKQVDQLL